ncbi:MAG TPA: MraY family glycosyltransferase [Anaerolineales bacterium]|nr:MraY family glycosyltransferase [Anaerolineales bacterium]
MTIPWFGLIFFSVAIALLLSPLAVRLAPRLRLIDIPGSLPHKQHDRAVPLTGGWVLLLTLLLAGAPVLTGATTEIFPVLAASLIVFVFGVVDDRIGLSAPYKLLGQGAASVVMILSGVQVRLFPPELDWANLLITVVWMVGITNAFNFVDSMDGLAVGLAALSAGFFMLAALEAGQTELSSLSAVLMGACIGVYFFNVHPARLFLGDGGSQWLGFMLAGIGIVYTPDGFLRSQSWFVPILLVGVPIFDTLLIVYSRLRHGRPLFRAGLDHTYHRMTRMGVIQTRAVLAMHLGALLLSCLAFILLASSPVWANTVFGSVLVGGVILIVWMDGRWR